MPSTTATEAVEIAERLRISLGPVADPVGQPSAAGLQLGTSGSLVPESTVIPGNPRVSEIRLDHRQRAGFRFTEPNAVSG